MQESIKSQAFIIASDREREWKLEAEIEQLKVSANSQPCQLPTALELLNELLKRRKISKVREIDVAIILDILGGNNEA
ncbi:hypothetical protein QUB08_29315 [Microcoleus sp. BR0-C5]|uniref:hypothetical protein n=1 Tax=Microcoleus sp. BR0-C5 TaxID=2818713 RepID=UPI002FD44565